MDDTYTFSPKNSLATLRRNTCYGTGRTVVNVTVLLSVILFFGDLLLIIVLASKSGPAALTTEHGIGFLVSLSLMLSAVLFSQLFNAVFDIADSHLLRVPIQKSQNPFD